jgi:hypothetical protein
MTIFEQLESNKPYLAILIEGARARVKYTGQIVELKRVSCHGISLVSFRTDGEFFISNKFLVPVSTLH